LLGDGDVPLRGEQIEFAPFLGGEDTVMQGAAKGYLVYLSSRRLHRHGEPTGGLWGWRPVGSAACTSWLDLRVLMMTAADGVCSSDVAKSSAPAAWAWFK
jgi:hypothetical protein